MNSFCRLSLGSVRLLIRGHQSHRPATTNSSSFQHSLVCGTSSPSFALCTNNPTTFHQYRWLGNKSKNKKQSKKNKNIKKKITGEIKNKKPSVDFTQNTEANQQQLKSSSRAAYSNADIFFSSSSKGQSNKTNITSPVPVLHNNNYNNNNLNNSNKMESSEQNATTNTTNGDVSNNNNNNDINENDNTTLSTGKTPEEELQKVSSMGIFFFKL